MEQAIVYLSDIPISDKNGTRWVQKLNDYNYNKLLISSVEEFNDQVANYFDSCVKVKDILDFENLSDIIADFKSKYEIVALYAPKENLIEIGGDLRSKFGIPGIQKNQALAVRDKWIMNEMLHQRELNTSKNAIAVSENEAILFAKKVGFPIVAKPLNGFATLNTQKLLSNKDISEYFSNLAIENELLLAISDNRILLESFIDGEEYHCDCVVQNGQVVFSSVSKYLYNCMDIATKGRPPASIVFSKAESEKNTATRKISELNEKVISALGINNTVTHGEYFVTKDGEVYFGEIGARIGGADVMPPIIKNTFNVDMFEAMIDVELQKFVSPKQSKDIFTGMICLPQKAGEIVALATLKDFKDIEGIITFEVQRSIGDRLLDVKDTMTRSGFAIIEDVNYDLLREKLLTVYHRFFDLMVVEE
ncbi:ATP-grasp domain-containing protein [Enterococcus sp. AZ126]|uniref:ATP-grasp domain-containing protein n=1 Tax=Enterococcus sp. AZ126 TaxID=2774635 RepID=UPI003F20F41D